MIVVEEGIAKILADRIVVAGIAQAVVEADVIAVKSSGRSIVAVRPGVIPSYGGSPMVTPLAKSYASYGVFRVRASTASAEYLVWTCVSPK
jgi:hypothetical protein